MKKKTFIVHFILCINLQNQINNGWYHELIHNILLVHDLISGKQMSNLLYFRIFYSKIGEYIEHTIEASEAEGLRRVALVR